MLIKAEIKKIFYNKDDFLAGLIKPDRDFEIPPGAQKESSNGWYRFKGKHFLGTANLEKMRVELEGEWSNDSKYGWGFNCSLINITDTSDLHFFMVSFVQGIGPALASQLIKDFGNDNLIDMIENRPNELTQINGIGPKLKERIIKSWARFSSIRKISSLLLPAGCSANMVHKVCKHFSDHEDIVQSISDNVFILLDVPGMSFKICDSIALKSGMAADDPRRVQAAIVYCLQSIGSYYGHTVILTDDLFSFFKNELNIQLPPATWHISMRLLVKKRKIIVLEKKYVALMKFYKAEAYIHSFIKERSKMGAPEAVKNEHLDQYISKLEKAQGFNYNLKQREAINLVNNRLCVFLAGIAGAGKTTTAKAMLEVLSNLYSPGSFCVTALSGIATDRIRKTTGFEGATIQSLLVKYEDSECLPFEVLVIDEGSMIPVINLYKLLKKVPINTRVVMIGDVAQIDPVGPGAPFSNIIKNAPIRLTNLTEPNRQSADSVIISIANDVRQGVFPRALNHKSKDFQMIEKAIPDYPNFIRHASEKQIEEAKSGVFEEIRNQIFGWFNYHKPDIKQHLENHDIDAFLFNYQLITPIKKGPLGTESMNALIQSCINPNESGLSGADGNFIAVNDKVVHNTNIDLPYMKLRDFNKNHLEFDDTKQVRVFNGLLGIVKKIDEDEGLVWIYYPADDHVVIYELNDARVYLQLAYALTVHKSQGSEFSNLIMPMHTCFYRMLSARLLYTAITRARTKLTIVGDPYAIRIATKNKDTANRNTLLKMMFIRQRQRENHGS